MKSPVTTLTAIISGTAVLVLTFIPAPEAAAIRAYLVGLAATLVGIAALVGIAHLVSSHWRRLLSPQQKDYYSFILLLAFFITVAAGLLLTPADINFIKVVTAVQIPIETSLLAVLAISLVYISFRFLQRHKTWMGLVFMISFVIYLLLGSGWLGDFSQTAVIGSFISLLPMAGARGLLLGTGIASLLVGIRILLGADRPYSR